MMRHGRTKLNQIQLLKIKVKDALLKMMGILERSLSWNEMTDKYVCLYLILYFVLSCGSRLMRSPQGSPTFCTTSTWTTFPDR